MSETTAIRTPTMLSGKEILRRADQPVHAIDEPAPQPTCRIHPEDYRELREAYRFCWPGNAPTDVFHGVRLIQDVEAERLPRAPL